jgi:hypothetical protein
VTKIGGRGTSLVVTINRRSELRLLVKANDVPSSQIVVTLMMEALNSSYTSVLKRATRRNIFEGAIFIFTAVKTSKLKRTWIRIGNRIYFLFIIAIT